MIEGQLAEGARTRLELELEIERELANERERSRRRLVRARRACRSAGRVGGRASTLGPSRRQVHCAHQALATLVVVRLALLNTLTTLVGPPKSSPSFVCAFAPAAELVKRLNIALCVSATD